MRVNAVLVDLDDTLYGQDQWLAGAWAAVADRASWLGLDGAALLPVLARVAAEGSDRGGIIDRALVATGVPPAPYVAALVSAFTAHAPHRLASYPGAVQALGRIRRVVPVVLLTDGTPRIQHAKIAALGLDRVVDHVVVSDELGGRALRKPHPASFLHALALLGLPPEDVVHVGDRPAKDVAGARAAGLRCVRVRTGEYGAVADPPGLSPWRSAATFVAAAELLLPLLGGPRRQPDREAAGVPLGL